MVLGVIDESKIEIHCSPVSHVDRFRLQKFCRKVY